MSTTTGRGRTVTNYSRNADATCERLTVRYQVRPGVWQAAAVFSTIWLDAEERATAKRDELLAAGRQEVEILRWTPLL